MDVSGVGKWVEVGRGWGGGGDLEVVDEEGVTSCFLFATLFVSFLLSWGFEGGRSLLFSCVFSFSIFTIASFG